MVGTKHVLEEFRVGVTAVMLAAKQHILQGNLKHKDLTGQEVSSQVCIPCRLLPSKNKLRRSGLLTNQYMSACRVTALCSFEVASFVAGAFHSDPER